MIVVSGRELVDSDERLVNSMESGVQPRLPGSPITLASLRIEERTVEARELILFGRHRFRDYLLTGLRVLPVPGNPDDRFEPSRIATAGYRRSDIVVAEIKLSEGEQPVDVVHFFIYGETACGQVVANARLRARTLPVARTKDESCLCFQASILRPTLVTSQRDFEEEELDSWSEAADHYLECQGLLTVRGQSNQLIEVWVRGSRENGKGDTFWT